MKPSARNTKLLLAVCALLIGAWQVIWLYFAGFMVWALIGMIMAIRHPEQQPSGPLGLTLGIVFLLVALPFWALVFRHTVWWQRLLCFLVLEKDGDPNLRAGDELRNRAAGSIRPTVFGQNSSGTQAFYIMVLMFFAFASGGAARLVLGLKGFPQNMATVQALVFATFSVILAAISVYILLRGTRPKIIVREDRLIVQPLLFGRGVQWKDIRKVLTKHGRRMVILTAQRKVSVDMLHVNSAEEAAELVAAIKARIPPDCKVSIREFRGIRYDSPVEGAGEAE